MLGAPDANIEETQIRDVGQGNNVTPGAPEANIEESQAQDSVNVDIAAMYRAGMIPSPRIPR